MRCSLLAFLLVAQAALVAHPAMAQPEAAQALLDEGNKLFAAGDYPAAYEKFKAGAELKPSPVFHRSQAFCLLKMLQHQQAREMLEAYLKKYPKAGDRRNIKEIIKGLEVVVQTRVTITSQPPGASIFIDTEAGGKVGVTPYKGTIEPGSHLVILKAPGYSTTQQSFDIPARSQVDVRVGLKVPLEVTSTPPGASIHLGSPDSPPVGTTPATLDVLPGKHLLVLRLPGHKPAQMTVAAGPADKPVTVALRLLLGFQVASSPSGATVELDGKRLSGQTPLSGSALPGEHEITVKLGTFTPIRHKLLLQPGEEPRIEVAFKGGLLSMRTDVSGATVAIGSLRIGATPFERATVPSGPQTVTVVHPDRRAWEDKLTFIDAAETRAELELGRPLWPMWTASSVALAGVVVGSVTGLLAMEKTNDNNENNRCLDDGTPTGMGTPEDCSRALHHASTASWATAGFAAAVALTYYLVWGRHHIQVSSARLKAASR